MRLGIFGGSFDPPHVGHLLVAQDALTALSLDRLLIVPAAQQPLKTDVVPTSPADRLAMVRRTFEGVPQMEVDPIEIDRGGLSFMVDTVGTLRQRWPSAVFHLLIGEDVVPTLPRWREVERLLAMVQLVVLRRAATRVGAALPEAATTPSDWHGLEYPARHLAARQVDVSSTEVRARVRDGRSIRGFVTDAVADYIASTGLYLTGPDRS